VGGSFLCGVPDPLLDCCQRSKEEVESLESFQNYC
jgi:hypothetical protein